MLCIKESSWMSDKFKKRKKKGTRRSHTEKSRTEMLSNSAGECWDVSLKANLHQTPSLPISFPSLLHISHMAWHGMDTTEPITKNYKEFFGEDCRPDGLIRCDRSYKYWYDVMLFMHLYNKHVSFQKFVSNSFFFTWTCNVLSDFTISTGYPCFM